MQGPNPVEGGWAFTFVAVNVAPATAPAGPADPVTAIAVTDPTSATTMPAASNRDLENLRVRRGSRSSLCPCPTMNPPQEDALAADHRRASCRNRDPQC